MSVGFRYPRAVVHQELHHLQVTTSRFEIPPGAAAHPVSASRTLPCDALGVGMFSHMHLRGKDMTFHCPSADWRGRKPALDSQLSLRLATELSLAAGHQAFPRERKSR
jgi:hypothetical protein